LNGHVQGAGDARAAQRLLRRELVADRHEARHFGFGDLDFLAPPIGQRQILDHEIGLCLIAAFIDQFSLDFGALRRRALL
jgi:hypothetical protein